MQRSFVTAEIWLYELHMEESYRFLLETNLRVKIGVYEVARVISTGSLHALLRFHTRPINLVVFQDSYPSKGREVSS